MSRLKLNLRGNTWHVSGTINKVHIRKSTGFKKHQKEQAERWALEYELILMSGELNKDELDHKPFKFLLNKFQDATEDISYKELSALEIVRKYLGHINTCDVRTDLSDYIATRHAKSKETTIDRDINGRIRAIINYGYQLGLCGPFIFKFYAKDNARLSYLEPDKRDAYLQHMPEQYHEFATVMNFLGPRFSQGATLTGKQVMDSHVAIYSAKGQKRRLINGKRVKPEATKHFVAMHPKVKAILEARVERYGNDLLFPEIDYQEYRKAHLAVCEALEIEDYHIHDYRRTLGTAMSQVAGATDREVASQLAQSTQRNVFRYSQIRDLKDVIHRL